MRLKSYLADWLSLRSPELKPRTVETYAHLIDRYISPALGEVKRKKLTPDQVRHFLAGIVAEGHGRTAEMCYVLLREALPELMGAVQRPAHRQTRPDPWSDEQLSAYLRALRGHRHELPLTLAAVLGLRRGEICGLRWQDIDFTAQVIHIVNQRQRMASGRLIDCSPKSASSVRSLPIPAPLLPLLRAKRQVSGYLCAITPSALDGAHRRLVARLGLPAIPLHGLRHTMATHCLRHGCDLRVLQALLGHASFSTTASFYTHPDTEMLRAALDKSIAL